MAGGWLMQMPQLIPFFVQKMKYQKYRGVIFLTNVMSDLLCVPLRHLAKSKSLFCMTVTSTLLNKTLKRVLQVRCYPVQEAAVRVRPT